MRKESWLDLAENRVQKESMKIRERELTERETEGGHSRECI